MNFLPEHAALLVETVEIFALRSYSEETSGLSCDLCVMQGTRSCQVLPKIRTRSSKVALLREEAGLAVGTSQILAPLPTCWVSEWG